MKEPHGGTNLVVADFYMLLHHDPCDRLSQGGRGQGAVVRPVIIRVGGKQAGGVKLGELNHAALRVQIKERHKQH